MDIDAILAEVVVRGASDLHLKVSRQQETVSLAFRAIPLVVPSLDELGLPAVCQSLAMKTRGLVLVTGPAGCGKSTELARLLGG